MVIVDVVTDIVNNVSAAVDGNTNGSMTPAERQTRGEDGQELYPRSPLYLCSMWIIPFSREKLILLVSTRLR